MKGRTIKPVFIEKTKNDLRTDMDSIKPVAYRWKSDLGYIYDVYDHGGGEALYTQSNKQLHSITDEDILDALDHAGINDGNLSDGNIPVEWMKDFARLVVRKAQEK